MYKIGSTSRLQIEYRKAIIIIRRAFWPILLGMAVSIGFYVGLFWIGDLKSIENAQWFHLVWLGFTVVASVQAIFSIVSSEQIEIDLANRTVVINKRFLSYAYKTSSSSWPAGHGFKYAVDYDSYKSITAIWLVAYSNQVNESRKLCRFFDKKTFVAFQKIFNENFPDNKILEWHD